MTTTTTTKPANTRKARTEALLAAAVKTTIVPAREPLAAITNLWRKPQSARRGLVEPFIDRQVRIERWFGRTADSGDIQYRGTVVAVAQSTVGTAADFVILRTVDGTTWAISTAQIAYLELVTGPQPRKAVAAAKR